jgi:drug/metabolite transporter (DMT)-like permease
VIFVALVAWVTLHERVSVFNVAAIMALVGGEVMVTGGTGHLGVGDGPLLVLAATLLWSVETVVAKRLLSEVAPATVGVVRMGVGVGVLVGYLALTGALGELGALDRTQWGWAALTGCTLAAYVATWFTALARARVLDVTSVLVGSVVVTAALGWFAGHGLPTGVVVGSTLVFGGVVATVVAAGVARRPERIAS